MVKKLFVTFSAVMMVFFSAFGFVEARTVTSGKMYNEINKQNKTGHYDYKNGSLQLQHVEQINLSKPVKVDKAGKKVKITKLTAAVASYKTVRDKIFYKDWNDYVYYAPEINQVLTPGDVNSIPAVKDFQKKYTSSVTLELGPILGLLALLIIVPIIFLIIWNKKKFSTLEYKIYNGLVDTE
ncbi:hypothetical protein [Scopulibacillus cellulosilyticus]|uniref:Uncharacterized protein n=1 Tax=Scopulibacillus cellulosilyticus TaxID=2665665 RepID=A0ABW2PW02_9BACL